MLNVSAADLPNFPFLHVTGTATRALPANMAELDFELTELTTSPQLSFEQLVKDSDEIYSQLIALGVAAEDIHAAEIKRYISPVEYLDTPENEKKFRLIRTFHVVVRKLDQWNSIISRLTEKAYLGNFNLAFGRNDLNLIQTELIQLAAIDAKQQAQDMAAAFSVKLGAPSAISRSALSSLSSELGVAGQVKVQAVRLESKPTTRDFSVPAELKYQQLVNVIYRLK
jgi:uncharacterized protein YggE